jgi:uncharacterized membrane protein
VVLMSDLPGWVQAVLIGGGIGIVMGFFVARRSASTKPIQGGALAHILHYLGAVCAVAPAPIVLVGAILYKLPFAQSAGLCCGSLALGFVMLLFFAYMEVKAGGKSGGDTGQKA